MKNLWTLHQQYRRELAVVGIAGLVFFLSASLASFSPFDNSWFHFTSGITDIYNWCGWLGAQASAALIYLFGSASWILVGMLAFVGLIVARRWPFAQEWDRLLASSLLVCVWATLLRLHGVDMIGAASYGGFVGNVLYGTLHDMLSEVGTVIFLYTMMVVCSILLLRFSFIAVVQHLFAAVRMLASWQRFWAPLTHGIARCVQMASVPFVWAYNFCTHLFGGHEVEDGQTLQHFERIVLEQEHIAQDPFWQKLTNPQAPLPQAFISECSVATPEQSIEHACAYEENLYEQFAPQEYEEPVMPERSSGAAEMPAAQAAPRYALPKLDIFIGVPQEKHDAQLMKDLEERAAILEQKLERFGVQGKVIAIKRGPVVTLFEYEPDIDSKISKIMALEDDLALALQALSIRIMAPIPGKPYVGFEVANSIRRDVFFSSVVRSEVFTGTKAHLPLVLGEDTIGNNVVVDLADMPHLLVAGSTGSGKSVALNGMLVSLLCNKTPDELKLILVDPKRLEFAVYADIAHLLFPIVTDPKKASPVLRWVVEEMGNRYEKMSKKAVRNIAEYNKAVKADGSDTALPFIVVVIDELADLMMTAGRDVEDLIARIAQMARAAGIHMILATQRPSVDVITGLIKVNFPSRISFRVTSKVDSRTILDCGGAEKLLGRGDMLFMDAKSSTLRRLHGAYVSDEEISKVVDHIRAERTVQYQELPERLLADKDNTEEIEDELYDDVFDFLQEVDEVSISLLQRKFRIGYNRSARIMEMLESHGAILPADGGKMRKVIR